MREQTPEQFEPRNRHERRVKTAFECKEQKPEGQLDYWYQLISEKDAADFLNVSERKMANDRYRGNGPS